MPDPQTTTARGYLIALASAAFLSTTAIFIRYLVNTYDIPSLVLAFWRDGFVALTLLPVLGLFAPHLLRVDRRHLRYLVRYGLLLALFNALWTLSVAQNGAALATVLVYSSAAFTALLGWWLLNEALSGAKLLAVALSILGCAWIAGAFDPAAWDTNLWGVLTGLLSGLSYAIYSMMGRSASQRGLNPWTTLFYTFSFATVFLLLVNLPPGNALPGTAARPADLFMLGGALAGWGVLFLLAAGPTVAGFGLYNVSLSHLPASVANLILTLEPAFTTVIAYLALDERLSAAQIGGSLLIMGGVLLLRISTRRRAESTHRSPPRAWSRRRRSAPLSDDAPR